MSEETGAEHKGSVAQQHADDVNHVSDDWSVHTLKRLDPKIRRQDSLERNAKRLQLLATFLTAFSIVAALIGTMTIVWAWFVPHALSDFDGGDSGFVWSAVVRVTLPAFAISLALGITARSLLAKARRVVGTTRSREN